MKKLFLLILVAVSSLAASCTNDNVTVEYSATFKINLNNVVDIPDIYEFKAGELEGVISGYKLRVRLLVYNNNGTLVASETEYKSSYNEIMSATLSLEEGEYTAVAITDVVKKDESFTYWTLSGENSITSARLTDNGYIGGQNRFLGVGAKVFSIYDSNEDVTIRPSLAGSILLTVWRNINAYNNVETMTLESNRSSKYLEINRNGDVDYAVENKNNEFNWRVNFIEKSDFPDSKHVYAYCFTFPIKNISFKYTIKTADIGTLETDTFTMNMEAGREYFFSLDLKDSDNNDEVTYNAYLIGGTKSSSVLPSIEDAAYEESSMSLTDLIKLTDKSE